MSEKIIIQNGDELIEITGIEKQEFLIEREFLKTYIETIQAEQDAKIAARQSALAKLAALGLTEEEIAAL